MAQPKTDLSRLNERQKEAVMSDALRLLVLAGAGSGKTKTLLQKLIYLIEEKRVKPSRILAITFTKNAANEMLDRLILTEDEEGQYQEILDSKFLSPEEKQRERYDYAQRYKWIAKVDLKTFHGLCYRIMRNFGVNEYDNKFKIIGDTKSTDDKYVKYAATESPFEVLHKLLIQQCETRDYLLTFKRFLLDYQVDRIHVRQQQQPMVVRGGKYYTTLNGTKVRSKSEQYIADWLFRHSIQFVYEPQVNFRDFDFRPDFYIPEGNLYLEHVSNRSFPMQDKEKQFELANKLLVKTFETQMHSSALFNLVLERIVKNRLSAQYQFETALSFEEEFKYYHKEVRDFIRQVLRVIDMVKVENKSLPELYTRAQADPHERVQQFYELAAPLIQTYEDYCVHKSYLDFNDMILRTISLFENHQAIGQKFREKYDYILVDEFQDVNNLQVELINRLLTPETQLFCVGDDWQSIYGFRGSNVDYIIHFQQYFPDAQLIKLRLNYRSTENIVGASNEVIRHNKFKVEKEVRSSKKSNRKIHIHAGKDEEDNLQYAVKKVQSLQAEGYRTEDILFLYRRSKMFRPYRDRFKRAGMRVSAKTIHASKGLEAKAVFILGLTEGRGGFPDIWLDDRIYQLIKPAQHDRLLEEERRLFYVAITRAKDDLFLITERGNESSFLEEIPDEFTLRANSPIGTVVDTVILCPDCESQLGEGFRFCPYCGTEV